MAGNGIEYCWGYGETIFRKINEKVVKNLRKNVSIAVSSLFKSSDSRKGCGNFPDGKRVSLCGCIMTYPREQIIANPKVRDDLNHDFIETNRKEMKLQL
jgi:hypothetical protein